MRAVGRIGWFPVVAVLASCSAPPEAIAPAEEARYVGATACRPCHAEIASTYAHTGMGRAWSRMGPGNAPEDFSGTRLVEIPGSPLRYRMTERDGKYRMTQFTVDGAGRERAADTREIVWVTGSNNHSRSYGTVVNGSLFQMPVCWYPEGALWDLCPGYAHDNDYFGRELEPSCVFCHNGRMTRVAGTRSEYEAPIPEGIGCERCHGPGSLHVAKWQRGDEAPTGGTDPTIVNPARLPSSERIAVCFQCHLGDSFATERVVRDGRSQEDWRPGMSLATHMVPFRWREATVEDFGISAQGDRLVLSRCSTESGGKLECLTCHDPHVTVYREDRPKDFFSSKCLGCHDVAACKRGEDCVSCHMRRAEPDDHPHTTFTDHWIRRRIDVLEPNVRTSLDLEPVIPGSLDSIAPPERAYLEARAYFLKALDVPQALQRPVFEKAEAFFRKALSLGYDTVDCRYFLGRTLAYLRRQDEALDAFRKVVAADPGHHDAAFDLGRGLLRTGKTEEASAVLEVMLDRHPRSAAAMSELATVRMQEGRLDEALELLDRAIGSEPWTATLHANRAGILAEKGRMAEALAAGEDAVRYDPENVAMWVTYSRLAAANGKTVDAAAAEGIARSLARRSPP